MVIKGTRILHWALQVPPPTDPIEASGALRPPVVSDRPITDWWIVASMKVFEGVS